MEVVVEVSDCKYPHRSKVTFHCCTVLTSICEIASLQQTDDQSWGRSLIFDLKIKDPSDFADLFDDLDHTLGSDLINGDLDLKITL